MPAKESAMTIELTEEQLATVKQGKPLRVVAQDAEFVILRADVFDRVILDDMDPEAMYPLLAEISPEDWEDPSVYGIT